MDLETTFRAIERAEHLNDLSALLFEWRDGCGVAHLVYHTTYTPLSTSAAAVLLLTYDPRWVERYTEQHYFEIDPVLLAGREKCLPIDWMTVDHETEAAKRFFAEAEAHGVGRHGFTLPIRGPYGERALFTFTSNETDHHWYKWRYEYLRDFSLISHYLHDRAMHLAGFRPDPETRQLSRREQQCLQRLAAGETSGEIAHSLNVSASAVRLYLKSASRKLACATVEQAAVKATILELLRYAER
jgi:DNA-binding CsgD family transcriptional regulator